MNRLVKTISASALGLFCLGGCSNDFGFRSDPNYKISSCMPNPFETSARIDYVVGHDGDVNFNLVDVEGRNIMRFDDPTVQEGENDCALNGSGLPSGVYFLILSVDDTKYDKHHIVKG